MNKLFKQWKNDFDSFWDKLPKSGRIFVGVVVSFAIAMTSMNVWITPQRKELGILGEKAPHASEIIPLPEKDLDIMEARIIAKKLQPELQKWKQQVAELKSDTTYLRKEYHAEVLLAIDELATNSGLNIRSRIDPTTIEGRRKSARVRGRGEKKTKSVDEKKKTVGHFIYSYEMVGDFKNMYAFLYRLQKVNGFFEISNIKIERFEETNSSTKSISLNKTTGLTILFDVTVYYL